MFRTPMTPRISEGIGLRHIRSVAQHCCRRRRSVTETREGGKSVIRIKSSDGGEKVYRIDLSQRHSPASERTEALKKWESYRLGAFVCFNTQPVHAARSSARSVIRRSTTRSSLTWRAGCRPSRRRA